MVSTFGNNIVSAFTGGQSVKAIYTYGEKVWPTEIPPSEYYISWTPSDYSGSFTIDGITYHFEDYSGYFSDYSGVIPSGCFAGRNFTSIETNAFDIGYRAFYGCGSLLSANLTNCVGLPSEVFGLCSSLRTVSLPICQTIGDYTFMGCTSLSSIELPYCWSLGTNPFYTSASGRRAYLNISVPNCGIYGDQCFQTRYLWSAPEMDFTNCNTIGYQAFYEAIGMFINPYPVYDFPNCTYIGNDAFMGCGMVTVKLSKVQYIGGGAFDYNYSSWDVHPTRRVYIYTSSVCTLDDQYEHTGFQMFKDGSWVPGWEIYVPYSLVSAYKADSVWSYYSEHIHAITN